MDFFKNAAANWKTTVAGLALLGIYGLQMAGVVIPGVHIDGASIAMGLGLIFAKDGTTSAPKQ